MERSSSRLYSGPLSQGARKILAVLRAQSDRSNNPRQMERFYDSQRELWAQSSRSMNQEERKTGGDADRQWSRPQTSADYQRPQTPESSPSSQAASRWDSLQRETSQTEAVYQCSQAYSHGTFSNTPANQSGQAPSSIQCELSETEACSLSQRDKFNPSLQIPVSLSEHQWRDNTEEIRPSFILRLSPDDKRPNEVLFPPVAQGEPGLARQPFSSRLHTSYDADNSTQKEKKHAGSWNILRNELESVVASDGRPKGKRPPCDPAEEASSGGGDGGVLFQLSKCETVKTGSTHLSPSGCVMRQETLRYAHSPELTRRLDVEEDLELTGGDGFKGTGQTDATLSNKTGSPSEVEDNDPAYIRNTPEVKDGERPLGIRNKEMPAGCYSSSPENIPVSLQRGTHRVSPRQADNSPVSCQGEPEVEVRGTTVGRVDVTKSGFEVETQSGTKAGLRAVTEDETETEQTRFSDTQLRNRPFETDDGEEKELPRRDTEPGERGGDRKESVTPEDSGRERCPVPTSQVGWARGSKRNVPRLHQHHGDMQTSSRSIRGTSSRAALVPANTSAIGPNSSTGHSLASSALKPDKELENRSLLSTIQTHFHHRPLIPSSALKRKHEALWHQGNPPPKIYLARRPPKWEPPRSSQEKAKEGGVGESRRTSVPECPAEPQTKASPLHEEGIVSGEHTHPHVPQQPQQRVSKMEEREHESTRNVPNQTPDSRLPQKKRAIRGIDGDANGSKTSHEWADSRGPRSKAGHLTETLTSDPRVQAYGKLNTEEKIWMLEKARRAKALVLTMVYQDGTTQLDPEQKLAPPVCGLLVLMIWSDPDRGAPEDSLGPDDSLIYLKLAEQTPAWAQRPTHQSQELFTRDVLLQVLSRTRLVLCYKAKDFLCTALQFYKGDITWKQVARCHIHDPQVSGWLLDPADPSSCYRDLLSKHCKRPSTTLVPGTKKVSQVISGLSSLYWLHMELCSKLQSQGLSELYSDMELNMIPVLAAMESHHIHVDKEALKRTSDLLGTKMKQLEQEAHRAAGQIFLVTSSTQLRTVLFEKLRLHERCENKKLPKTVNKQQQSTSEAALLQLQDLHPLPKIVLEYRQIHKIKSTFVDGILSCMMSKNYISSTWYQTSVVTGRISAKHPNFQALPRQPLHITKKQCVQGKEEEVLTVHPRAMFIPQKGWTFIAADFCQVELRLLAHLSSDPELLHVFTNPQADVFTMLASQWKGVSEGEVTSEDREHAKRVVYSVVYGAGRERLSGILGVSADQAGQFQDSFLQRYREVQAFIQRTVQLCHKQGYVLSIMGRRRTLPNINSPDWGIRMQAERQAVNFTVQGSAADLCKTAMIRIFNLVSTTDSLTASFGEEHHGVAAAYRPSGRPSQGAFEGGSLQWQVLGVHV
ncbi:DNA polymerase nu isoform X3 [Scophthalmus maximus]|uniref:DNA polymerase nu isoform X3 n=1 Tax=Scophthalmus maximus TaxID=52904 RepID=UPI001FA864EF|nr:DNA polymerase nu isoform X3 [Scophthalmus maximus]